MLITLGKFALTLGLISIPCICSLDVLDFEDLDEVDEQSKTASCIPDQECLKFEDNNQSNYDTSEEISYADNSDSDLYENFLSKLKILEPVYKNDPNPMITINVREIQNGFHNYGSGYNIGNIPNEEVRVKRQSDVTNNTQAYTAETPTDIDPNLINSNVNDKKETSTIITSNFTLQDNSTKSSVNEIVQNSALPISNSTLNGYNTSKVVDSNLTNIPHANGSNLSLSINDNLGINVTPSIYLNGKVTENIGDVGVRTNNINNTLNHKESVGISNLNNILKNILINLTSPFEDDKNLDITQSHLSTINSLEQKNAEAIISSIDISTTINNLKNMLENILHDNSVALPLSYRLPTNSNDHDNTPVVVYNCKCGINEPHSPNDHDKNNNENDLGNIINTRRVTSEINSQISKTNLGYKLANINGTVHNKDINDISKKINEANLHYWQSLASILSNTLNSELSYNTTLNTNEGLSLNVVSSNDVNPVTSFLNNSNAPSIRNDTPIGINDLPNNGLTNPQINQGLTDVQATNQNQDQISQITNRKRRNIMRNLKHTSRQSKTRRQKRQVTGELNELMNNYPYLLSHHAFHHMNRPYPHHAFHRMSRPYPHHAFHHINRPPGIHNSRKALRHLINSDLWYYPFGNSNVPTELQPFGNNDINREIAGKRDTTESRTVTDTDESGSVNNNNGKSGLIPNRFNFTVNVLLAKPELEHNDKLEPAINGKKIQNN